MAARPFVGGAVVGAGLVYFLDREHGPARRARLRGQLGLLQTHGRYGMRLGDIGGLEAANLTEPRSEARRRARVAGGLLLAYGILRRGRIGRVLRSAGLGLLARGIRGGFTSAASRDRRHTIDIQKTLYVSAPLERVYAFWSDYANLPLILSNIREVRDLGAGRSRWVVTGPGDRAVSWDAVLTARDAPRLLSWRSEPGAILENAGVVRFTPEGSGTRIDFRFCYSPPRGLASRALAEFFGGDPRAQVNENLGRLKALLESGVTSSP